jgi:dolichol-phosphate mannosyltransferase
MVMPTYNESDRLTELTEALFAAAGEAGLDLELVIVDDNSPDGTGQIADDLAKTRRMRVVHRSGKLGLGTAVVAGFNVALADTVGVMDADFSHPPSLVPKMMKVFHATDADVLVASRYIPGGSTPNWPFKRRLLSRIGCLLARGLSPIRDAASGFFLIRRDIVRGRPGRLVEVPYQFDDRELGESKMSVREAAGYLVQLKDLYLQRLTQGDRRRPTTYRQLARHEVERIATYGA